MKILKILVAFLIISGMMIMLSSQNLSAKEPYKIGFIGALTGPASSLGEYQHKSAIMAEEEVNKAGGINGHPFKLIVYDDQSDPVKGVLAAKRLIQADKVSGILGPSTTPLTLPVAPVADQAKIPLISIGSAIKIVDPVRPYIFKVPPHGVIPYWRMYESFIKARGIKKVAFIHQSDSYGLEGKNALEMLAKEKEYGFNIVEVETYKPTDTDMTPILTKIKVSDAEALIVAGIPPGTAILVKNAKGIGLKIPVVLDGGSLTQKFLDLAGDGAEGIFLPAYRMIVIDQVPDTNPQKKVIVRYLKAFKERWNIEAQSFGGLAYEAIQMFINGLKEVGPDPKKLRDYIENLKGFIGITSVFSYSPTDHAGITVDTYPYICIVKGGKFVIYRQPK